MTNRDPHHETPKDDRRGTYLSLGTLVAIALAIGAFMLMKERERRESRKAAERLAANLAALDAGDVPKYMEYQREAVGLRVGNYKDPDRDRLVNDAQQEWGAKAVDHAKRFLASLAPGDWEGYGRAHVKFLENEFPAFQESLAPAKRDWAERTLERLVEDLETIPVGDFEAFLNQQKRHADFEWYFAWLQNDLRNAETSWLQRTFEQAAVEIAASFSTVNCGRCL